MAHARAPCATADRILSLPRSEKHRVAVVRQEGSNGDREMHAALHLAGFEAWDVNMNDLAIAAGSPGAVELDQFRGVAFVGGFSYADVNDSAKGWAGAIRFNPVLLDKFERFRDFDWRDGDDKLREATEIDHGRLFRPKLWPGTSLYTTRRASLFHTATTVN